MEAEERPRNGSYDAGGETDCSRRCVRCGERIPADSPDELARRYTAHVVDEHGAPAKGKVER